MGIDYDCRERMVYWTDVAGRTISRASLEAGAEPETIITSGQQLLPMDTCCFTTIGLLHPGFSCSHLKEKLNSVQIIFKLYKPCPSANKCIYA